MTVLVAALANDDKYTKTVQIAQSISNQWNYLGINGLSTYKFLIMSLIFIVILGALIYFIEYKQFSKHHIKKSKRVISYIATIFLMIIVGGVSFVGLNNHIGPAINRNAKFSRPAKNAYENENLIETKGALLNEQNQYKNNQTVKSRIQNELYNGKIPKGQHKMANSQIKTYQHDSHKLNHEIAVNRKDLRTHKLHPEERPNMFSLIHYM